MLIISLSVFSFSKTFPARSLDDEHRAVRVMRDTIGDTAQQKNDWIPPSPRLPMTINPQRSRAADIHDYGGRVPDFLASKIGCLVFADDTPRRVYGLILDLTEIFLLILAGGRFRYRDPYRWTAGKR